MPDSDGTLLHIGKPDEGKLQVRSRLRRIPHRSSLIPDHFLPVTQK
jgi:hypothetical protein